MDGHRQELRFFQHDGARPHTAALTQAFLQEEDVHVLDWVPYSPDFNPIEHLWDILGRKVAEREPQTRHDLIHFLTEEWEAIPQDRIRRLIQSMRKRCRECVAAHGGHTSY
jgi:transposase